MAEIIDLDSIEIKGYVCPSCGSSMSIVEYSVSSDALCRCSFCDGEIIVLNGPIKWPDNFSLFSREAI
jgi:hypothetical protein